ncbi:MAG: sulfite exporter TauE/SafE family protein [Pseudomonadota bacterium]
METSWLYMYMPISGVEIFWPGLVLIGFSVGVIGGFFGMGGAWMVTPGLNILGFPMAFAIGTDIAHIAGKSIVSTIRHSKFGNVDYKLGLIMVIGTFAGIECGAQLVMYLERLGVVGSVVRWVYVAFLFLIALMVFSDYAKARKKKKMGIEAGEKGVEGFTWYKTLHKIKIPPMMHFKVAGIYCSAWLPIFISFLTGVLAGFLGIGGGLLRMPALVYFIGVPTHIAVGTDLFEVMISGLYGAFTYTLKGRIELVAVFVMLTGAAIGAQIGTVATKYSKGYGIRIAFGIAVVCCMISVILKEFKYGGAAAVLILSTIAALCAYIIYIMFKGAAAELREKKAREKAAALA